MDSDLPENNGSSSSSIIDEYDDGFLEARSHNGSLSPRSQAAFSPQPGDNRELVRELASLKAENERLRGDTIRLRADEKRALDLCDEAKAKWVTAMSREDDLQKSLDKARADVLSSQNNMALISVELETSKVREKRSASSILVLEETIASIKTESKVALAQAESTFLSKLSALEAKNEASLEVVRKEAAEKLTIAKAEAQHVEDKLREEAEATLTAVRAAHAKELVLQQADAAEKMKKIQEDGAEKVQAIEAGAKSSAELAAAKLQSALDDAEKAADTAAAKLAATESSSKANLDSLREEIAIERDQRDKINIELNSTQESLTISQSNLVIAKETIQAIEAARDNLVATKDAEIARLGKVLDEEISKFAEHKRSYEQNIAELVAELSTARSEHEAMKHSLQVDHEAMKNALLADHERSLLSILTGHNSYKQSLVAEHEATVSGLQAEIDSLTQGLQTANSLITEVESLTQSLQSANTTIAKRDSDISDLQTSLKKSEDKYAAELKKGLQSQVDSLTQSLQSANTTIAKRDSDIFDLQTSLKKSEDKHAAEVLEKTATKSALSAAEIVINELNKSLQDLGAKHTTACSKIEELTLDLVRSREKCDELASFLFLAKSSSEGARDAVVALQQIESTETNFESNTLSHVRPADNLDEATQRKEEAVLKYQEEVALHSSLVDSAVVSLAQVLSLLNNDLDGINPKKVEEKSIADEKPAISSSSTDPQSVDSLTAIAVISRLLHKTVTDTARERAIRYSRASEVSDISIVDSLREKRKMLVRIRSRVFESVMKTATVRSDSSPSISAVRMAETVSDALLEFISVMDKAVRDMGILLPQHDLEEIELGISGIKQRISNNGTGSGGGSLFSPQPPPVPSPGYSPPSSKRTETSPLSTRSLFASSLLLPETPLGAISSGRTLTRSRTSRASSVTLASPRRFCGAANCMREHKQGVSEQTYASVRTFAKKTVSATATEKLLHSSAAGYSPASWSNRLSSQSK
jgi:hypothetical protein